MWHKHSPYSIYLYQFCFCCIVSSSQWIDMIHSPIVFHFAWYMRQWIGSALLQKMACRLFGAKALYKPMLDYCQLDSLRNKLQWNLNQNTKLFTHVNASVSIVCEMAAMLSGVGDGGWGFKSTITHLTQNTTSTNHMHNSWDMWIFHKFVRGFVNEVGKVFPWKILTQMKIYFSSKTGGNPLFSTCTFANYVCLYATIEKTLTETGDDLAAKWHMFLSWWRH